MSVRCPQTDVLSGGVQLSALVGRAAANLRVRLGVDTGFRCCGCRPWGEVWLAWASLLRSYQTASPLVARPGVRSRNAPHAVLT